MRIADAIVRFAAQYPSLALLYTETLSDEVPGVAAARDKIRGQFNANTGNFDYSTPRNVLSRIFNQRYGDGFGLPIQLATQPGEAGYVPDVHNRNYGWEEEENFGMPTPHTLVLL